MKADATTMQQPPSGAGEVWVGGNPRPAIALAALLGAFSAAAVAATLASGLGPTATGVSVGITIVGAVAVAATLLLARAAALPRIERRGDHLRVRVAPTRIYDLPLDVVECFFHGAHAIGHPVEPCTGEASEHEEHDESSGRRRTTLVVRVAERARDWQERPTFAPWAGWKRGSIVLDGLWYEPLPMERFGALAERLVQAKRSVARREKSR